MSLNLRIIVSATLVLIIFITLTAAALDRAFYKSTETSLRDNLTSQLFILMAATEVDELNRPVLPTRSLDALFGLPSSGIYAHITNQDSQVLWASSSILGVASPRPEALPSGEKRFARLDVNQVRYYRLSYGVNWPTETGQIALTFNIATDLNAFNKQIQSYRTHLWGWLIAMAVLLLLGQALILRWGLSPLRKVSSELDGIDEGEQERLEGHYPQELKRLADKINLLFDHERQQKTRYRNALGDLAHSLKTPLAIIQSTISEKSSEDTKILTEQIGRMNTLVEYQLQRAATAGSLQSGVAVPVHSTTDKIISALQKVYRDKNIQLKMTIDSALVFKGDEGDLMELLGNLLDNAFKWARQTVQIHAEKTNQRLNIVIEDDGPGMDKDQITELLQRGRRADQSVAGHGIGLSIVSNIVQSYNGRIHIDSSPLGGARIQVWL